MTNSRLLGFFLLAAVALAATGCSPAQQIVGKWDLDTTKALGSEMQAADPLLANLIPLMQPKVQVAFEGDGNYSVNGTFGPQSIERKGSWRYVKMDGKALVLMVKEAGKTDENELRITLTDADHAEMSVPMPVAGKDDEPRDALRAGEAGELAADAPQGCQHPHSYAISIPGRSRRITMTRILSASLVPFVLCALIAALSGCGGSPAPVQRLPGKWNGKVILTRETIGNSLPPAVIAELAQMKMGMEFTADGKMILSGLNGNVPYQSQGKWQLISQEGDVLTFKSIESDGLQKDVVIVFDGKDKFTMPLKTEVANIGAMEFERLR